MEGHKAQAVSHVTRECKGHAPSCPSLPLLRVLSAYTLHATLRLPREEPQSVKRFAHISALSTSVSISSGEMRWPLCEPYYAGLYQPYRVMLGLAWLGPSDGHSPWPGSCGAQTCILTVAADNGRAVGSKHGLH